MFDSNAKTERLCVCVCVCLHTCHAREYYDKQERHAS